MLAPLPEISAGVIAVEQATPDKRNVKDYSVLISETNARPLMSETRRPVQYETASVDLALPPDEVIEIEPAELVPTPISEPQTSPPQLRLLGIFETSQETRALLSVNEEKAEIWMEVGDVIEGWTVADIATSSVRLVFGDIYLVVEMYD